MLRARAKHRPASHGKLAAVHPDCSCVAKTTQSNARCNVKTAFILFGPLIVAAVLEPAGPRAQWKTYWSYDGAAGPNHWGDLDPAYAPCKTGREQSPIDIRGARRAQLPALRFEFKSAPLKYLINNGYTIRVNYHDAPGTGSFLVVDGKRYQLIQFHFHRPSEEQVSGKPYPMEVHFMLKSAEGRVAGVVTFLKVGAANPAVQKIWDHMPATKSKEREIPGLRINPADLLPRDKAYYLYMGSVTAPPCTEGVTWFVLKTPVDISAEQIRRFAKLYPHDVRPVQPLDGRLVQESP